jgi:PhoPQ-activated pathogenicity-related protein
MLIRVMKNTFAVVAIVAVAALLIATTAVSSLTNQAFASKKSFHQTAAQSCINENVRCQNIQDQLQGQDNAGTVVGNQPAG